jgi:CRP-like cAMP-binding protein
MALLRGAARTATVRAVTPVSVLRLDRRSFFQAVAGGEVDDVTPFIPEAPSDPAELLRRTPLLREVGDAARARLLAVAAPTDYAPGEVITTRGERDDRYFVVLSGGAEASGDGWSQALHPGDGFGEIAVLHDVPRTATVRAVGPTRLLVMSGNALRGVVEVQGGRVDPPEGSGSGSGSDPGGDPGVGAKGRVDEVDPSG